MELEGNAFNLIQTLDHMNSIDDAIDDYYDLFHDELASELPLNITSDRKLTLKRITDLYRSAGTEPAVKLLFRILYGEEIEIEYPSDNILRPSDGIWVEKKYITLAKPLTSLSDPNMTIDDIQNREVFFSESGAYAITESYEESNSTYTVYVSNLVGTTMSGDNLRFFNGDDNSSEIDEPCIEINGNVVQQEAGYYDSTRGFLSDNIVIQDGFKFQQYSYTIRSSVPIEQYSEILKRTVHPAGVRFDSAE